MKEKYKISICPECNHIRICHSDWNLLSICCCVKQIEIHSQDFYYYCESLIKRYKRHSEFHMPFQMNNAGIVFLTDEEVIDICNIDKVKKPMNRD